MKLSLVINGVARHVDAAADMPLLWLLRDQLGLTGTKYGCGAGLCGACTEGGIGYGLGAALRNAITLTEGRVDQSNFHDYEPLRIDDMPRIEVHIMPSTRPPTGVGEAAVPPIAPAVANAIFAATGRRTRVLPFRG